MSKHKCPHCQVESDVVLGEENAHHSRPATCPECGKEFFHPVLISPAEANSRAERFSTAHIPDLPAFDQLPGG